jgi:dinuclear metal center YbgI/SA1388 family protein
MKSLRSIAGFLDAELNVAAFSTDSSNNGVQVENSGRVNRICCGVDASLEFFEAAQRRGADLVVCHHGISWGDSLKRITGLNYRRISFLVENDMALYVSHLPLDAHPRHGNNAQMCRVLGLKNLRKFGSYHGMEIGFQGRFARPMDYSDFKVLVRRTISRETRCMDFGKRKIQTVAVISVAAPELLDEAADKGIDVFLSGETKLAAYIKAKEYGINAVFAGHYATEIFGVKALAGLLKKKFGIPAEFINMRTPY